MWTDAIYTPTLNRLAKLSSRKFLALATLMQDAYGSVGLCAEALGVHDIAYGSHFQAAYLKRLAIAAPKSKGSPR